MKKGHSRNSPQREATFVSPLTETPRDKLQNDMVIVKNCFWRILRHLDFAWTKNFLKWIHFDSICNWSFPTSQKKGERKSFSTQRFIFVESDTFFMFSALQSDSFSLNDHFSTFWELAETKKAWVVFKSPFSMNARKHSLAKGHRGALLTSKRRFRLFSFFTFEFLFAFFSRIRTL